MANDTQKFDKDGVMQSMENIGNTFTSIGDVYTKANTSMTTALSSPDQAMWGDGADKLLAAWDANSAILDDFMKTFENWSAMVSATINKFGNLETETYLVEDAAMDDIATVAKEYKSSWLKTDAAKKAYIGGDYTKTDENGTTYAIHKSLEDGLTKTYTDANGNTITELYSLSGAYIGKKVRNYSSYKKNDIKETLRLLELKKKKIELNDSNNSSEIEANNIKFVNVKYIKNNKNN